MAAQYEPNQVAPEPTGALALTDVLGSEPTGALALTDVLEPEPTGLMALTDVLGPPDGFKPLEPTDSWRPDRFMNTRFGFCGCSDEPYSYQMDAVSGTTAAGRASLTATLGAMGIAAPEDESPEDESPEDESPEDESPEPFGVPSFELSSSLRDLRYRSTRRWNLARLMTSDLHPSATSDLIDPTFELD